MAILNTTVLNTGVLNAINASGVIGYLNGNLIAISQIVTANVSGTLVSIEQTVQIEENLSGTLISIEQSIIDFVSGNLVKIAQTVQDVAIVDTFFNRTGYDVLIYINNQLIDPKDICDSLSIVRSENQASQCTFTLKPSIGVQNPEAYLGLPCFVNIQTAAAGVKRVFTGWVDNPNVDIIQQKIKFECTDRRRAQIMNLPYSKIYQIGSFNKYVFGEPQDQEDELNKRLQTVAGSFDFDSYGNPVFCFWQPKNTPDITLTSSDVYYDEPRVIYTNRNSTVNKVNITLTYTYQRLHQQLAYCVWNGYNDFMRDWYQLGSPSFPQRDSIAAAAKATSWVPLSDITYTPLWPAGGYSGIVWQPNQIVNTYVPKTTKVIVPYSAPDGSLKETWPNGQKYYINEPVLDSNGKQVFAIATTTITDTSSNLCRGATWTAVKRLTQSVTELYSITMSCPSAITKYGKIDSQDTVTINDPYDSSGWTGYKSYFNHNVTPGTAQNAAVNSSGYSKGATQLTLVAAGTGSFTTGNQIIINGDPSGQTYIVQEGVNNVAGGGVLTIMSPGLAGDLQSGTTYSITLLPAINSSTSNLFINEKPLYSQLAQALSVAVSKGETTLLRAFRDTTVSIKKKIFPEVELYHTITVNTNRLNSRGKVSRIEHVIDFQTTEAYTNVNLLLSRAPGSDTQSAYNMTIPPYEDYSYIGPPSVVTLGTHIGEDPNIYNNPQAVTWNGFVGNKNVGNNTTGISRTRYPETFTVDYPAISPAVTLPRTVTSNTPGVNSGVKTDNAGYSQGTTTIHLAAVGTGKILKGDTLTITGDSSLQVYVAQNDILDVSSGGVLNISPGLGAALVAAQYPIVTSSPANQFTVAIPSNPLTISFIDD